MREAVADWFRLRWYWVASWFVIGYGFLAVYFGPGLDSGKGKD